MSVENGRVQWKCIEDHFEFDYVAGIKWTWSILGDRWKAYKYKLRCQHFYPNKSKEEILANRPSSVPPTEWTNFVTHYKDDKMKKISEHSGRVRVLGVSVCPTKVFGMRKNFSEFVNGGSSSQNVEDLKKQVHSLEEKLTGYEETKDQLAQTQNQLALVTSFLQGKFGDELPIFNQGSGN